MNIVQLQYNLEFLLDEIRKKNQEEVRSKCLSIIHQYSLYFIGNKNYLQHYKENKMTLFGILDQLISDICQNLTNQYQFGPVVPATPAPTQRIDLSVVQDLCRDLSSIVYV